jgi:hypothetical protein
LTPGYELSYEKYAVVQAMFTDDDEETDKTIEPSTDGARKAILQELQCHGVTVLPMTWTGRGHGPRTGIHSRINTFVMFLRAEALILPSK